jgi:hypothetical protein
MKSENAKSLLNKYAKRLALEGSLKALALSLSVGLGASFVAAAVAWFKEINPLLLCLAVIVGCVALGTPIFYAVFFRPTLKSNAKRIDLLGLDERTITMLELEEDDSIIARIQREDARAHLAEIDEKMLTINVPKKIQVSLITTACAWAVMFSLSLLAAFGLIMSGAELMEPLIPEPPIQYVYIEYIVEEGGYIEGEEFQEIIMGQNGQEIMAVPEDGWIFVGWEDGIAEPSRAENEVTADLVLYALFEPSGEEGEGDGSGDGEGEGEGEGQPTDAPGQGEGKGQNQDGDDQMQGAGGKYEMANQIIDGEIYYREVLQQYQDMIDEYLASGEDIPEDIRKIIETYLEIIG